ncbi:hypothetical protein C9F11_18300 [Streptomyces sp. YIM 121038]|nr:hypothetical protein C9F11_18300 [Streptomyces sp. YIM 121038]
MTTAPAGLRRLTADPAEFGHRPVRGRARCTVRRAR